MSLNEVKTLSKKTKKGELVSIGTYGPYDMYKTEKGRTDFNNATEEERRTLFFYHGILQSDEELDRYRQAQMVIAAREAERRHAKELQEREEEEYERKKKEEEAQRAVLEKCLSSGAVGLCMFHDNSRFFRRLIQKGLDNFTLDSDLNQVLGEINFMDTRREMNETTGFHLRLRNNEPVDVHDIEVACFNVAESGTVLGRYSHKFYIRMRPGDVRDLDLVVPDADQQVDIKCAVTDYDRDYDGAIGDAESH